MTVGGSTALQILEKICLMPDLRELDTENKKNMNNSTGSTQVFFIVFSVTFEGPIHELCLHFQLPKEGDLYDILRNVEDDPKRRLLTMLPPSLGNIEIGKWWIER